uniref:NOT2/NOT3/NOT5 C-terminal domain-containing protein n=2 Tax=Schistocephalus solidus TaxID=70667 RepID=A0A0X3PM33_SCHSO
MPRMAGIGQRNTYDYPASWSSAAQLGMGRTMPNESSKNLTSFPSLADKRSVGGTGNVPVLGGLTPGLNASYASRTSSASRSKGLGAAGEHLRNNYNPDSSMDNGPMLFNYYPSRGLSEPSTLSVLGSSSHPLNAEPSSLVPGLGSNSKGQLSINALVASGKSSIGANSGFYSGSSNLSSSNLLNPGVSSPGLTFDPSEFPPIVSSVSRSQTQNFSANASHRNYVFAISKGSNSSTSSGTIQNSFSASNMLPTPEFSIDQDFPALPVAQSTSSTAATSSTTPNSTALSSISNSIPTAPSSHTALKNQTTQRMHPSHGVGSSQAGPTSCGSLQLLSDHVVANIPKNMICDQFGMIGLLKLIKIRCHDGTFNMLAPGFKLTSLGVINSQVPGELYTSFLSPCHDSCMGRPQDVDFAVPPEYLIRHFVADRLPDPPLDQLSEEILFWLFYNCCREEVQLVAAKELYRREWRFHKKQQVWLTRVVGAEFSTDSTSEQGIYHYWDFVTAEKITKKMHILYDDLDNTPDTFRLSSNTLSASVGLMSPPSGMHPVGGGVPLGSGPGQSIAGSHVQSPLVYSQQHQAQVMLSGHTSGVGSNGVSMPIGPFNSAQFPSPSLLSTVSGGGPNASGICRPGGSGGVGNVGGQNTRSLASSFTNTKAVPSAGGLTNGPSFPSLQQRQTHGSDKKAQQQTGSPTTVPNASTVSSTNPNTTVAPTGTLSADSLEASSPQVTTATVGS